MVDSILKQECRYKWDTRLGCQKILTYRMLLLDNTALKSLRPQLYRSYRRPECRQMLNMTRWSQNLMETSTKNLMEIPQTQMLDETHFLPKYKLNEEKPKVMQTKLLKTWYRSMHYFRWQDGSARSVRPGHQVLMPVQWCP